MYKKNVKDWHLAMFILTQTCPVPGLLILTVALLVFLLPSTSTQARPFSSNWGVTKSFPAALSSSFTLQLNMSSRTLQIKELQRWIRIWYNVSEVPTGNWKEGWQVSPDKTGNLCAHFLKHSPGKFSAFLSVLPILKRKVKKWQNISFPNLESASLARFKTCCESGALPCFRSLKKNFIR